MEFFQYKAIDSNGRIENGRVEAINAVDLEVRLQKLGLDLINCCEIKSSKQSICRRNVDRRDLIMFCFHLEQTIKAGVPILESLEDFRDSTDKPRLREVISGVSESIEGGKTLSEAMRDFPDVFNNIFTSLVNAGEQTGEIDKVLSKLGESIKWQDEQVSQLKKLIMYPAFVGIVVIGVIFFLMVYLVPELLIFIKTMGQELPMHTMLLVTVSDVFVDYWYLILLIPLALITVTIISIKTSQSFRYRIDKLTLNLPVIGPIIQKLILARVTGIFAMMYASGITIIDCLHVTREIADNLVIKQAMDEIGQKITEGSSLSQSFATTGLFPTLVLRMIIVGENTGGLQESLENISYFYTRDVRESIEILQSMIEPSMTVILGTIIGWIMLSVLGPIYDVITSIDI